MIAILITLLSIFGAGKKNGNVEHFYDEVICEMGMDTYVFGIDATPLVKTVGNDSTLNIEDIHNGYFFGTLRGKSFTWNKKGECLNSLCREDDDLEYSKMWLLKP